MKSWHLEGEVLCGEWSEKRWEESQVLGKTCPGFLWHLTFQTFVDDKKCYNLFCNYFLLKLGCNWGWGYRKAEMVIKRGSHFPGFLGPPKVSEMQVMLEQARMQVLEEHLGLACYRQFVAVFSWLENSWTDTDEGQQVKLQNLTDNCTFEILGPWSW